MTRGFGSPYGKGKVYRPYRGAQLGVSIRRPDGGYAEVKLTPTRIGCLKAIEAGKVRYYPSAGWKCEGRAINALIRDCVRAGWAKESLQGAQPIVRVIALTDAGRKAIGLDEVGA